MSKRPLNVGLVGGGKGAFIVQPHQKAIHFDGTRRVTAAALFPDPKIALEEAANWPYPIKGYGSYDEMIAANATLLYRADPSMEGGTKRKPMVKSRRSETHGTVNRLRPLNPRLATRLAIPTVSPRKSRIATTFSSHCPISVKAVKVGTTH